jgi:hypothetical protein
MRAQVKRKLVRCVMVVVAAVLAGCGVLGSSGPRDARSISYEVHYSDLSLRGEAEVTYTRSDGSVVSEVVATPWESGPVDVRSGVTYRLSARTVEQKGSHVYCGVHTDNGWNLGDPAPGGECSFAFPDDISDE